MAPVLGVSRLHAVYALAGEMRRLIEELHQKGLSRERTSELADLIEQLERAARVTRASVGLELGAKQPPGSDELGAVEYSLLEELAHSVRQLREGLLGYRAVPPGGTP